MALPATLPDPDRNSPGKWHCETCEPNTGRATRLKMHCGRLPRAEWPAGRGSLPLTISGEPYTSDECPGSLVRQPAVTEAAKAHSANETGILDRFDPLRLHVITEAVLLAKRAFNLDALEKQKRAAERIRRG